MRAPLIACGLTILVTSTQPAFPWGDDGHKAIALIAQHCLTPEAQQQVDALLATDSDNLTKHDIASEATWADKYRNFHREETRQWHYTDIEIAAPDLNKACFGRPALPPHVLASNGPPAACAVDKVEQFATELAAPNIDAEERRIALKFILHLVGDIHQPLHSSDNNDHGGNDIKITADGFAHKSTDNLHYFWDVQIVRAIAAPPRALAKELLAQITPEDAASWATGSPDDWAMETFNVAKTDVYGTPPLSKDLPQTLSSDYTGLAEVDARIQLSRAAIRLAYLLNRGFGPHGVDWATCLRSPPVR